MSISVLIISYLHGDKNTAKEVRYKLYGKVKQISETPSYFRLLSLSSWQSRVGVDHDLHFVESQGCEGGGAGGGGRHPGPGLAQGQGVLSLLIHPGSFSLGSTEQMSCDI